MNNGRDGRPGEVFFEFTLLGQQLRVAAIDAATATEVVIIAPLAASRSQVQSLALAKLRRKLGETADAEPPAAVAAQPDGRIISKTV